jgi:Spy/CpxP family protein refolding chaperone
MASDEKQNGFKSMVKDVIDQILPSSGVELTDIKEEIWQDLSALYYKYEDEDQKRAFREVMYDICRKIQEGKWDSVYRKLYRVEQKEKAF